MNVEEALNIVTNLNGMAKGMLRQVAVERMVDCDCEEIGSSDVSFEMVHMVQYNDYCGPDGDEDSADILRSVVVNNPAATYEQAAQFFSEA